jgi:alkaline phosphatase D
MNRRDFLTAGALVLGTGVPRLLAQPKFRDNPFTLGVASGDPWPDSVVLWTRLMQSEMPHAAIPVRWRVAHDEKMTRIVREDTSLAEPEWAHSVHVEVRGLEPDRWYWYQFDAGGPHGRALSPVGRTKTAPARASHPARFTFAFVSCQKYETGYYTAIDHLCEEDLSLVIHVGDYIYEKGPAKAIREMPLKTSVTLEDYRARYAFYKADPSLQEVHRRFPFIVTPDDHEVANNYAALIPEKEKDIPGFEKRRAGAYQAYYEHMPLRSYAEPRGIYMRLYRTLSIGGLADFHVLDTRQYRDDQPCGDGDKTPCEARNASSSTIMGKDQEAWLYQQLAKRNPRWSVLAQQVILSQIDLDPGPGELFMMDKWDGYAAARKRLTDQLVGQKKENVVVLSGDNHNNWAIDVKADFENEKSPIVGAEFAGTSLTSGGDGADMAEEYAKALPANPHIKFHNSQRGYVRCVVTPEQWISDYRIVPWITRKGAPVSTRASFVVEAGRPGMQKAAG